MTVPHKIVVKARMHIPMPEGISVSPELPEWLKLAIAEAVILFGRMEQEVVEISWLNQGADLKRRLKLARTPATENFIAVIENVEQLEDGLKLDAVKDAFRQLADERNLIVHGSWHMADDKPWAVWHKFLEDEDSIIGEFLERGRFDRFMAKGQHLLATLRSFHSMLEDLQRARTESAL